MRTTIKVILLITIYSLTLQGQVIDVSDLYQSEKYFYPKFQHINETFGFPELRIQALEEDQDGFLWIGTIEGGLWRYDGYEFQSFRVEHNQTSSLQSNNILDIHQDTKKILWILTDRGLCYYNPLERKIMNFEFILSNSIRNSDYQLTCLAEDKNGQIFIGTNNSHLIKISLNATQDEIHNLFLDQSLISEMATVTEIEIEHKQENLTILDMVFNEDGRLWLVNSNSAGFLNPLSCYSDSTDVSMQASCKYLRIIESSGLKNIEIIEPNIYCSSADTLYIIPGDQQKSTIQKVAIKNNTISSQRLSPRMDLKGSKKLWIGDHSKPLSLFNEHTSTFYPLSFESIEVTNSIYNRNISCLIKTTNNVIFIGTYWGGLFKFEPNSVLAPFHPDLQRFHLSKIQNLRYVYLDSRDLLWFISDEIYAMNRHTGKTLATIDNSMLGISFGYKNKMIEDRNGRYWVAAEGHGVLYFDIEIKEEGDNRKIKVIELNNIIPSCYSTALYEDKKGNIWAGTTNYKHTEKGITADLIKISPESLNTESYHIAMRYSTSATKENSTINHIIGDKADNIWMASDFGLIKFDPVAEQRDIFPINYLQTPDDKGYRMLTVSEDPWDQNQLWIGTAGGGLFKFDKSNESFQQITSPFSIEVKYVNSIIKDHFNTLWLSTENGIIKMRIDEEVGNIDNTQIFNLSSGLNTNDFRSFYGHNASITSEGEMVFSGDRGFQIIDPALVKTDSLNYNLFFEELYIDNEKAKYTPNNSILTTPLQFTSKIRLPYNTNSLGFKVTSPNFYNQDHIHYSFLLKNYNDYWVRNNGDRNIQYFKLRPGKYQLMVKMEDIDQSWSKITEGPIITVSHPWWKSVYAYIIYGLLFCALVWIIVRIHLGRQSLIRNIEFNRLEAEKLKELDMMKSRFYSNISHGLRTPLTLILAPIDELLNKLTSMEDIEVLEMMKRNANRLSKNISDILELTKIDSYKVELNLRKVDVIEYTNYIVSNFKSWAKHNTIKLNLESKIKDKISIIDPEKYRIILSNLLSNAIKYSENGGEVQIKLFDCSLNCHEGCNKEKNCLMVSLKDTGRGIPNADLPHIFDRYYRVQRDGMNGEIGTGLGLSVVKEMVKLHRGTIDVQSEEGSYTEFIIRFPYHFDERIPKGVFKEYENLDVDTSLKKSLKKVSKQFNQKDGDQRIILIVEDDRDMRDMISSMLKNIYQILEAENGSQGLDMAISSIPDLIISDIMMPEKDGYELTKEIKQNTLTNHIPIILLTAKAELHDKIYGLDTGADDYLTKPFYKIELLTRIRNLIEQRKNLKQKYSHKNILSLEHLPTISRDQDFIKKLQKVIEKHFSDESFSVQILQNEMGISRTQLHRKLKALTNKSASELIRTIRLEKAAEMISNKTGSISEIAYLCGFSDPSYFSRVFKEKYGCKPSEYIS